MSARFLFVRMPWRSLYHAIYAAYVGVVGQSIIIDIDHWRHYFLIRGVLWGLMTASNRYLSAPPAGALARNAAA